MLPADFPSWKLVYYYFCKWSRDGTLEEINDVWRDCLRKKRGRKRHIITDTQGLLLAVRVHAANEHDSKAAYKVIKLLKRRFERMTKIYADGGYRGELVDNVKNRLGYQMEITLRSDKSTDFKPLPQRWVVERSFAWLERFRRLAKDYERTCKAAQNMIHLAFIALMLKWL